MVINNRIDRITTKDGSQDLHYLGVFFVKDGHIKEWSDYEVGAATPVKPGQPL
jgi:limonene-1,2-epoxide hydrolase